MKRHFSKLSIALEITIRSNDPISGVSESKNELTISLLEWRTIPHYQFQLNLDLNSSLKNRVYQNKAEDSRTKTKIGNIREEKRFGFF